MKKFFLTLIIFIVIAFIGLKFGTRAFTYSDENTVKNPPVHFLLNPYLWLPSYLILHNDVTDFTILKSLLYVLPYWLVISYLLSSAILWSLGYKRGSFSPKSSTTKI